MEKIHGTSTWITFNKNDSSIRFHSGGETKQDFEALFDKASIIEKLSRKEWVTVKIHGEGYGGKQQGMSETYGPTLKFIVFDIYVKDDQGEKFLDVPDAHHLAEELGLTFVHYIKTPNNPAVIEEESNKESIQAIRNKMGPGKAREGVVVKPTHESLLCSGKRCIFKHKNENFWEIKSRRPLGERLKVVSEINDIVNDWVTDNRFKHVLDRVLQQRDNKIIGIKDVKLFVDLMVEDVERESEGEVLWSPNLVHAIRRKAGLMFRSYIDS